MLVTTIIGNAQSPEQDGRQSDRQKFRPNVERQEGMRALRVAFYEDQLDLSAEESRLFWPAIVEVRPTTIASSAAVMD